jgi:hypothetical protein
MSGDFKEIFHRLTHQGISNYAIMPLVLKYLTIFKLLFLEGFSFSLRYRFKCILPIYDVVARRL